MSRAAFTLIELLVRDSPPLAENWWALVLTSNPL
jgi:hypothetical protein